MPSRSQSKGTDGKPENLPPLKRKEMAALRKIVKKAESGSPNDMLKTLEDGGFFATAMAYPDDKKVGGLVVRLSQKTVEHPDVRLILLGSSGFLNALNDDDPHEFLQAVRVILIKKNAPIPENHQLRDALSDAALVFFEKVLERKSIPNPKGYICKTAAYIATKASLRQEASWKGTNPKDPDALGRMSTDYCSENFLRQSFNCLYSMLMGLAPTLGRTERVIRMAQILLRGARNGRLPTTDEQAEELGITRKLAQGYEHRALERFQKLKGPVATWCRSEAYEGKLDAQFVVAALHYFGWGLVQSYAEGMLWLEVAANGGHAGAQFQLSLQYAEGCGGVRQNRGKAMIWLRRAAEQGHADAKQEIKEEEGLGL